MGGSDSKEAKDSLRFQIQENNKIRIDTPNQVQYTYLPISTGLCKFSIQAANDAHIAISSTHDCPIYEVCIGTADNTKTIIKKLNNKVAEVTTFNILHANGFHHFWLSWNNKTITLGRDGNNQGIISWTDQELVPINYVGVRTCNGSKGSWIIDNSANQKESSENTNKLTSPLSAAEENQKSEIPSTSTYSNTSDNFNSEEPSSRASTNKAKQSYKSQIPPMNTCSNVTDEDWESEKPLSSASINKAKQSYKSQIPPINTCSNVTDEDWESEKPSLSASINKAKQSYKSQIPPMNTCSNVTDENWESEKSSSSASINKAKQSYKSQIPPPPPMYKPQSVSKQNYNSEKPSSNNFSNPHAKSKLKRKKVKNTNTQSVELDVDDIAESIKEKLNVNKNNNKTKETSNKANIPKFSKPQEDLSSNPFLNNCYPPFENINFIKNQFDVEKTANKNFQESSSSNDIDALENFLKLSPMSSKENSQSKIENRSSKENFKAKSRIQKNGKKINSNNKSNINKRSNNSINLHKLIELSWKSPETIVEELEDLPFEKLFEEKLSKSYINLIMKILAKLCQSKALKGFTKRMSINYFSKEMFRQQLLEYIHSIPSQNEELYKKHSKHSNELWESLYTVCKFAANIKSELKSDYLLNLICDCYGILNILVHKDESRRAIMMKFFALKTTIENKKEKA